MEAIRLISHSLPCPLPSSISQGGRKLVQEADLPLSASAAPALAAAAGYFIAPTATARGESKLQEFAPSNPGITTALHTLTSIIQHLYKEDDRSVYIHVSHAISSSIPLSRLPSQPLTDSSMYSATSATTGGLQNSLFGSQISGDGYFSPTVFNSIVIAQDAADAAKTNLISPMPSPVLPPYSLHYSLLERFIPPPTPSADTALFSSTSSPLLDRIFELSPDGGCLLFIYPTKTGAKQFCDKYLGQVLDPLLRRLMVLYRLKDDLLWGISRMTAVEKMQEFSGLERRLNQFCKRLSDEGASESRKDQSPKLVIPVSLVHSQKVKVQLNQFSWREWWAQQEQNRIREVVKNHFSRSSSQEASASPLRTPSHDLSQQLPRKEYSAPSAPVLTSVPQYNGPSDLAREILDGVKASTARPSSRGMGDAVRASAMVAAAGASFIVGEHPLVDSTIRLPQIADDGIEVGIFVLRRCG